MKTFLIAFALGVFVGCAATAFFSSPDAYEQLQAAKAKLLGQSTPEPVEAAPEVEAPAEPLPIPTPHPQPEPAPEEAPDPAPEAAPPEPPADDSDQEAPPPADRPEPRVATEKTRPSALPGEPESAAPQADAPAEPARPNSPPPADSPSLPDPSPRQEPAEPPPSEPAKTTTTPPPTQNEQTQAPAKKVDDAILTAIRGQYKLNERIRSSNIVIGVSERVVTLHGEVAEPSVEQDAISIAAETKGVIGVRSELKVTP